MAKAATLPIPFSPSISFSSVHPDRPRLSLEEHPPCVISYQFYKFRKMFLQNIKSVFGKCSYIFNAYAIFTPAAPPDGLKLSSFDLQAVKVLKLVVKVALIS